jgi:cytidylate kinase
MVIAIDGPAGAGKSTVAKALAAALGFTYLDSGAMYRSVALAGLEAGADLDSAEAMGPIAEAAEIRSGEEIRTPEVSAAASRVSVHPAVRDAMVARQRALIESGDFVAEGRDIGTVVSPESPLKVFLNASPQERAQRRAAQTGEEEREVFAAQQERDARDTGREHGALRAAQDSVEIDTTGLTVGQVVDQLVGIARKRGIGT